MGETQSFRKSAGEVGATSRGFGMRPDGRAGRIACIDIGGLVDDGIRCVLVDLDNTCVPRRSDEVPADIADWLSRAKEAGLSVMVVSNNFRATRVARFADSLGIPHSFWAMKPLPFSLLGAARRLGVRADEAVMVGDQAYTDVLAGNLAGMRTILVDPQDPDAEPRYTKLMRRVFRGVADDADAGQEVIGDAPGDGDAPADDEPLGGGEPPLDGE